MTVLGDAGWLERLLLNLLDNAIKFTPSGGVIGVRVRREGGEAVLEVRDTGIGIAARRRAARVRAVLPGRSGAVRRVPKARASASAW